MNRLSGWDRFLRFLLGIVALQAAYFWLQGLAQVLVDWACFVTLTSLGVAVAPANATEIEMLVRCADNAMYEVKTEGRNDVRFFSGSLSDERAEQQKRLGEHRIFESIQVNRLVWAVCARVWVFDSSHQDLCTRENFD